MGREVVGAGELPLVELVPPSRLRTDKKFAAGLPVPSNRDGILESVALHGVLIPLFATKDWFVLDGHTRLGIAQELELEYVPVQRFPVTSQSSYARTLALVLGLDRRQLNVPQRVLLGTSIEKQERLKARERMSAGASRGVMMRNGRDSEGLSTSDTGFEVGRTSAAVAKRLGLSTPTYERVRYVLRHAPEDLVQRLVSGTISVLGAVKTLQRLEVKRRAEAEVAAADGPGIYRRLEEAPSGRYRCLYADPPWPYEDEAAPGASSHHYPSLSLDDLGALDLARLAHPEGCHLWLWTTMPKLRSGAPHALLERWGFRWVGEVVWNKLRGGVGRWMASTVEMCILAVRGNLPLLEEPGRILGLLDAPRPRVHSAKPPEMRERIERWSPGPRLELFARSVAADWDGFGREAQRQGAELKSVV